MVVAIGWGEKGKWEVTVLRGRASVLQDQEF